jgi:hypothetical protein
MPFDKLMIDTGSKSMSIYHWLVERLPATFTYEVFEKLMNQRRGLTETNEEEIKRTLRQLRKLRMIGAREIQNRYKETTYFIRDLYCQHYKKGKYARTTNGEQL